ncbi:hypothetical protein AURDEDRAFT_149791 [Auricularia subglabra TFB-10046 SS5]|nr:hypothetical protein AURDEDRAFT_149791 [Auricularia subglabra TFB-10046 SS5]
MPPLSPELPPADANIPEYFQTLAALDEYFEGAERTLPSPPPRLKVRPKCEGLQLLVCHDYKGGYKDSPIAMGYTFNFWSHIDVFIYFSHHRVAPPPSSWIRAAHREGVPILGTLIFEWDESKSDLCTFLYPADGDPAHYARRLARLAEERGFDGWLLNVEVALDGGNKDAKRLKDWILLLKQEMKSQDLVIWYDSVTDSGALRWQDRLCAANEGFFAAAGKLFTNYTWAPHYPQLSVQYLEDMRVHRHIESSSPSAIAFSPNATPSDIFVGIDVWGRGTHGGGGFGVHRALEHIAPSGASTALFAPAWTWESREAEWTGSAGWEAWWAEECRFWTGAHAHAAPPPPDPTPDPIIPGFYPAGCHHPLFLPIAHFFPARPLGSTMLPWATTFCPGVGRRYFNRGRELEARAGEWTDVSVQTYVPSALEGAQLSFEDAWAGGSSLRLTVPAGNVTRWVAIRELELEEGAAGVHIQLDVVWKTAHPELDDLRLVPGLASEDDVGEATLKLLDAGWTLSSQAVKLSASHVALGISVQGSGSTEGEVLLGSFGVRLAGQQWDDERWGEVFSS